MKPSTNMEEKLGEQMKQDFWKKWTSEYLSRLQQRSKWTDKKENMKIGDIVLVKQDNINPNHWPLGRVTQCHPGNDGFVRVATIRCKDGKEIRRPITKICILPVEQEERRNDKTNKVGPSSKNKEFQTRDQLQTSAPIHDHAQ
ncbi:uncharacterized protein LOC123310345 [Coccinella septempunctata]|uniref:uncharacterized protein LOC123310345 n=1 Tax=Coccinella septempunctata TaxID=41139 RepID=UPI001D06BDE9|nr:uncharacterized protein LOC123310345 [Coccinella septempunctata]